MNGAFVSGIGARDFESNVPQSRLSDKLSLGEFPPSSAIPLASQVTNRFAVSSADHTVLNDYIFQILRRINEVAGDEDLYDSEFIKPSGVALAYIKGILPRVGSHLGDLSGAQVIYPDGSGGLRLEWRKNERQVRLVIHGLVTTKSYIYYQDGEFHEATHPVTAESLASRLDWLNENAR